jgi:hypothetical protein
MSEYWRLCVESVTPAHAELMAHLKLSPAVENPTTFWRSYPQREGRRVDSAIRRLKRAGLRVTVTIKRSDPSRRARRLTSPQQGERIWEILVRQATNAPNPDAARITYGAVAEAIGYSRQSGRSLRRALGLIGWWCLDRGYPALNCLVVNHDTMECGESAVHTEGFTTREERERIANFIWRRVQQPIAAQLRAADRPSLHIP